MENFTMKRNILPKKMGTASWKFIFYLAGILSRGSSADHFVGYLNIICRFIINYVIIWKLLGVSVQNVPPLRENDTQFSPLLQPTGH